MKVRKAVIPAAGLGTRMLPATKTVPKEMLPLVDKPVIQYIIEEAVAAGIEDILVVTNRAKSAMDDYFDYYPELEERLARAGKERMMRHSMAWPLMVTSSWDTLKGSPAATRICSLIRSILVTISVTGCSTWILVFISMK